MKTFFGVPIIATKSHWFRIALALGSLSSLLALRDNSLLMLCSLVFYQNVLMPYLCTRYLLDTNVFSERKYLYRNGVLLGFILGAIFTTLHVTVDHVRFSLLGQPTVFITILMALFVWLIFVLISVVSGLIGSVRSGNA
jgi:hypothetical protein